MTPEELEELVLKAKDPEELQRAFAGLDERARAKLSSPAQKLYRQLNDGKANQGASSLLQAVLAARSGERWNHWNAPENQNARLALFAVGPLSTVKKRDLYVWGAHQWAFRQIMRDRRPEWLDEWIAFELEAEVPRLEFATLRAWIRDGICAKPTVDGYYRLFASHLMRTGHYQRGESVAPLSAQLLADPDLLDDVEGLFRVENIAFNTNSWLTKGAAADYETWPDALVKLTAAGKLDRGKLMNLALEGLTRDLKQNQLAGFHGFYKRLAPTSDELAGHQQQLIDLLCHPVGHVVKFAIDMLGDVEKQGALDTDPVVREIQVVFAGAGKGNAAAALKLLKRILAGAKGSDSAALGAVCEALRPGNAEIQDQALTILEANRAALGEAQLDAVRSAESFVAASNRARLAALLAGSERAPAPRADPTRAEPVGPAPDYRPINDDINAQRILFDEDRLEPVASVDELIETLLHAVEVVDSPDEVERIIDGISRFSQDRPFDFEARVAPLVHRVKQGRTGSNGLASGYGGAGAALTDLVFTWLEGRLYRTEKNYNYYSLEDGFFPLILYLRGMAQRVVRHERRQLLAAPTHKGGWIDPLVWVERLAALETGWRGLAESMDFRLSLLRLAPDHRPAALAEVERLGPELRRIARFALGGDELPKPGDRDNYAGWISAARCRSPLKDWSAEFAPLNLHDELPDALRPAHYRWATDFHVSRYGNQSWKTPIFKLAIGCDGEWGALRGGDGLLDRLGRSLRGRRTTDWQQLPTAALARKSEAKASYWGDTSTTWVSQWLAYVWPQNPAAAMAKGAVKLTQRIDQDSSNWTPGHGFVQALFQRNRPWREAGHLLLALALCGKDADVKGLAVDALIEGIDGRRFDPALFAATVAGIGSDWLKLNRLGEGLMPVVRVSPLHAAVVGDSLAAWLPKLDLKQRNVFHLLEVLVEAQATAPRPLAEPARAALAAVSGSGKAAKLARQVLAG